jgi:hypothetical protein
VIRRAKHNQRPHIARVQLRVFDDRPADQPTQRVTDQGDPPIRSFAAYVSQRPGQSASRLLDRLMRKYKPAAGKALFAGQF